MIRKLLISTCILSLLLSGCSIEKIYKKKQSNASPYQQIDLHAMVQRYLKKDKLNSIEGIYSVSGLVTKRGKGFMSNTEKEKITDRQENYAQVAILRDPEETGRDYIELSLDKVYQPSYSIVGEFNTAAGRNILVYKHLGGKSKGSSFTFTFDKDAEMLEGIRVESEGNTTVTYNLTYIKIYPK